ncbi:fimbrial protein [Candidatus Glomeribacter gigasporarum]|uniref:fimbrial protein n=1 Tax=Candidatus Glomeribacter gigasporarum TaxID=132144 RepID=UPI0005B2DB8C|nr:fimbrial protein [Candidatus Glomeribacter gigasporarum]
MMKRFILMGMTAAAMGSISSGAGAQTTVRAGRIDFNGVITATACQIQGNNQQMTVPLGTHFSQQFGNAGARSRIVPFDIQLVNCPTFRGVTVTYNGTGATANTDLLVVTDTTNNTQRQDVGIRLYDTDQTALLNLNANSTAFNITGANHTVRSAATFEQIGNNAPAAGNFQGNVNLDINYP